MKKIVKAFVILVSLLVAAPAFSQSATNALSTCLTESLTGKERKMLAKWMFFGMGAHPDIKQYLSVDSSDVRASDQYVGALFTRLLTVDCAVLLKAAHTSEPTLAAKAFEAVGRAAMQELMSSEEAKKAMLNYIRFADMDRINKVLIKK